MKITYKKAQPQDCNQIAELMNIAADGLLNFFFDDLVPGADALDVVAKALLHENPTIYYPNYLLAKDGNNILGAMGSYDAKYNRITEEMRDFIPADRLEKSAPMFNSRVDDTLYIESLAVYEQYRSHGIATRFLELAEQKANDMGLKGVSLHVFDGNTKAKRLYEKFGFEEYKFIKMQIPGISVSKEGMFLMYKKLS